MHFAWTVAAIISLAGCGVGYSAGRAPTVCRPADIEPATLGIGDLVFGPGQVTAEAIDDGFGGHAISIHLDDAGTIALADLTKARLGQPLDLSIDGEVVSSPVVQTPIEGGRVQVTSAFSRQETQAIAVRLASPCDGPGE